MSGRERLEYGGLEMPDDTVSGSLPDTHETQTQQQHFSNEFANLVIGELLGISQGGRVPIVRYPAQHGTAAIAAQTLVDLYEPHVGRKVALMFEGADARRPVIIGVLCETGLAPDGANLQNVEVEADGERLILSAREQLVLRCGNASVTLTKSGKVLIKGTYISSRSTGANRITGGSVQLN